MQECTDNIVVHDKWRVFRAGRLQHAEDLHIDTTIDDNARQACMLHHYSALSTLVLLSEKNREWLEIKQSQIRALSPLATKDIRIGVSVMPSRLVIRALGSSSFQLRKFLIPCIEILNDGRPVPTVWNV
jgi:urease accessory protein UreH